MASSLLFRIKSVLDPSGFKNAQAAFTNLVSGIKNLSNEASSLQGIFSNIFGGGTRDALGVQVTRANSGLQALTGGLISLKTVGIATAVTGTVLLAKGLQDATQEAARSELSTVRLRAQLEALGIGGEEAFAKVERFATRGALSSAFASDEIEQAIALVVKRTGDLDTALRSVSIAQDIAAGTGQSLSSASLQVTQALLGNVRAIKLLTGARDAEIKSAVAQGKILELLDKRTRGLAQATSSTLIVQQKILRNTLQEISKTIGESFLPAATAVTKGLNELAKFGLVVAKNFDATRFASSGLIGAFTNVDKLVVSFSKNLAQTGNIFTAISKTASDLTKSLTEQTDELASAAVAQGNLGLAVQRQEALLLQNQDERLAKLREIAEAEAVLKQIELGNLNEINKARLESARKFKEVDDAVKAEQSATATKQLEDARKDAQDLKKIFDQVRRPSRGQPRQEADVVKEVQEAAKILGLTEEQTNQEIERRLALLREQNALLEEAQVKMVEINRESLKQGTAIQGSQILSERAKSPLESATEIAQPIRDGLTELANAVKSISPVINQTINPITLGNEIARIVEEKLNRRDSVSARDARTTSQQSQRNSSQS